MENRLKLYEYMACGKPVITGESCGDFVRDNDIGIVIPEENHDHAANTIIQLLKDNALMNSMGENGRKLVINSFTWEITTKRYWTYAERYDNLQRVSKVERPIRC